MYSMDELKKKDVLGLNLAEGKDIFMLAVALGLNSPAQLKSKEGLFLNTALKTADRALMASVLLGTVTDEAQLDEYANLELSADLCEQCAEAGYQVLQRLYNDADCNADLLERRLLRDMELLYMRYIEADI